MPYGKFCAALAKLDPEEEFTFEAAQFPGELADLTRCERLVVDRPHLVTRGGGDGDRPFEMLQHGLSQDYYSDGDGYRWLGVWLLHLLFSGRDWAGLELGHAESRVAQLWVSIEGPPLQRGLKQAQDVCFSGFEYIGAEVSRHAFADMPMGDGRLDPQDRPRFMLGWSDQAARLSGRPEEADQVIWSLSPNGLAALAELFFDFAIAGQEQKEINIEAPHMGFAGAKSLSVEARFWLPGSFGFAQESLEALRLPPVKG